MFIPHRGSNTVVLIRSYVTREGTFTPGHRFELIAREGYTNWLRDDEGRVITLSDYELSRLV